MIFESCIDQGCSHVMNCKYEPLFTQDEMKDIYASDQQVYPVS